MKTLDIPRRDWSDRLNEFTSAHEGWLVSIDVLGSNIGVQPEIRDLPLLGIAADRPDHDGRISISVARTVTEHLTHVVHDVTRLYMERSEEGADVALEIQSADGTTTLLTLRIAALTETVDGVLRC